MSEDYLDPKIVEQANEQERIGGIDIVQQPLLVEITVNTKNSTYFLVKADQPNIITIQGGDLFAAPTEGIFSGSNWGGSMIKKYWIGKFMHMEIFIPKLKQIICTSSVLSAKVKGKTFEYEVF